jgi:hypothetical protein
MENSWTFLFILKSLSIFLHKFLLFSFCIGFFLFEYPLQIGCARPWGQQFAVRPAKNYPATTPNEEKETHLGCIAKTRRIRRELQNRMPTTASDQSR